jgi:hypothetical protein
MKRAPTISEDLSVVERRARLRDRLAREADAIAAGGSDIVYDEPLTPSERSALGLDRSVGDAEEVETMPTGTEPRP